VLQDKDKTWLPYITNFRIWICYEQIPL